MSAVTILAVASQARSGTGSAVDVSAFSTLRLNATTRCNLGADPMLRFYIETGPSASGPWRTARELVRNANGFPFDERVVLSGFDTHMRVRWEGRGSNEPGYSSANASEMPVLRDLGFVLGLTGDGKPDAS